jgi:hypothetical protein
MVLAVQFPTAPPKSASQWLHNGFLKLEKVKITLVMEF